MNLERGKPENQSVAQGRHRKNEIHDGVYRWPVSQSFARSAYHCGEAGKTRHDLLPRASEMEDTEDRVCG